MHPSRLRPGPRQSRPLTDASPGSAQPPGLRVCRAALTRRRNIHIHAPFRTERQSFLRCRDVRLTISPNFRPTPSPLIWVLGLGDESVMAFTDDGVDSLVELIKIHRETTPREQR